MLSYHTCPLATLGGKDTGGMNVYVRKIPRELGTEGIHVDVFTRSQDEHVPHVLHDLGYGNRVFHVPAGPETPVPKQELADYIPEFVDGVNAFAKEKQGTVTVQVNLNAPADAKSVRLWIPYPMSDRNQDITDVSVNGNFASSAVYNEPKSKSAMLYAEWKEPAKERTLTYSFHVKRQEIVSKIQKTELPLSKEEFKQYLDNAWLGASEAMVKAEAAKITKGKKTTLAKAKAIYDWVVDNMRRDPNAKGCGLCDIERLLTEKAGKCADVHSVFTALCCASGIPAREV